MIPKVVVDGNVAHGFPRVSGDDPQASAALQGAQAFSPRERG